MNQKKDTEISPSKQNVQAVRYLISRERHKKVSDELGGSASGFDGFEEIMESYLLRAKTDAHARDPDQHLTLDTVVCLGLHVEEEENQYVAVISTPSLLLNPIRALRHGLVRELYGDATHKISHHLINLSQMAVNDVSGRSHLWGLMFQPHGTESCDYYKQFYITLLGGMIHLMEDVHLCADCEFCNTIREVCLKNHGILISPAF